MHEILGTTAVDLTAQRNLEALSKDGEASCDINDGVTSFDDEYDEDKDGPMNSSNVKPSKALYGFRFFLSLWVAQYHIGKINKNKNIRN